MSWQASERKAASALAQARSENGFGWRRASPKDRWEKIDCPRGVLARGGVLNAHCSSRDCSRRVRLDLGWWIARGFGDAPLKVVFRAYECGRLPCALSWNGETYPQGVPLMSYAHDTGAAVIVHCRACRHEHTLSALAFIDALLKAGRVSPNIPAWRLDHTVTGGCRRCGATAWSVRLVVPGQTIKAPPGVG